MHTLIVPFGIATFVMLIFTAFLGFGKWKLRLSWIKPKYHYTAAIITVTFGTVHLLLNVFTSHH